jgi:hypothetical protein
MLSGANYRHRSTVISEYLYYFFIFDTMLLHSKRLWLIEARGLDQDSLVVEIASNDGYLTIFRQYQRSVLGIEPAQNIAQITHKTRNTTLAEFFNAG